MPRPTIASEIKVLKELSRGSPGGLGGDMLNSYQSQTTNTTQFVQGNSLANFIWNKGGEELPVNER